MEVRSCSYEDSRSSKPGDARAIRSVYTHTIPASRRSRGTRHRAASWLGYDIRSTALRLGWSSITLGAHAAPTRWPLGVSVVSVANEKARRDEMGTGRRTNSLLARLLRLVSGCARMTVGNKRDESKGTDGVSVRKRRPGDDRSAWVGHTDENCVDENCVDEEFMARGGLGVAGQIRRGESSFAGSELRA